MCNTRIFTCRTDRCRMHSTYCCKGSKECNTQTSSTMASFYGLEQSEGKMVILRDVGYRCVLFPIHRCLGPKQCSAAAHLNRFLNWWDLWWDREDKLKYGGTNSTRTDAFHQYDRSGSPCRKSITDVTAFTSRAGIGDDRTYCRGTFGTHLPFTDKIYQWKIHFKTENKHLNVCGNTKTCNVILQDL